MGLVAQAAGLREHRRAACATNARRTGEDPRPIPSVVDLKFRDRHLTPFLIRPVGLDAQHSDIPPSDWLESVVGGPPGCDRAGAAGPYLRSLMISLATLSRSVSTVAGSDVKVVRSSTTSVETSPMPSGSPFLARSSRSNR